jgi:peptidoglycan/LPS O-acetylase OafA/YrhL
MKPAATARYRPLGAYRFGLALMVVLQHYQHLLPPEQRGIFSNIGSGAIAVAAFFTVSGFVVAEALATFYNDRPGAFITNRLLRLGPPYMAALALSLLVHAALWRSGRLALWDYTLTGSPLAPARLLTGLLGLVPGFNPRWLGQEFEFVPYVWSLRLEIAFYAVAAIAMAASWRLGSTWPIKAAIALALAASAAFLLLAHRPGALSTAPMFLVGVAFYLRDAQRDSARTALLAVTIATAAAGFVSWRQHGAPLLAIQFPVLAVLLGLFAWLLARGASGRNKRLDRSLGDLSYPLYLNHYAVGIAAASLAPKAGWALFALSFLAAVLLAAAAERAVDRPIRALRDRIRSVPV